MRVGRVFYMLDLKRILEHRFENHSQREIARMLKVSRNTVCYVFNAEMLQVSIGTLLTIWNRRLLWNDRYSYTSKNTKDEGAVVESIFRMATTIIFINVIEHYHTHWCFNFIELIYWVFYSGGVTKSTKIATSVYEMTLIFSLIFK